MKKQKNGFIKTILLVIGALVLLKYVYNIDVIGFLTKGKFRELLDQFYRFGSEGWHKYENIITKVWDYAVGVVKGLVAKFK